MTRSSSRRTANDSSARPWIGRILVAVGIVLGTLAALGGEAAAGAVIGLTLGSAGGALLWIGHGIDERAVTRRRRVAGIGALGSGGMLVGLVGAAKLARGEQDGTVVLFAGATAVAGAGLWWMASRNSREPDIVCGPVRLGDGRREPGKVVAMPRSKRIALVGGAALMALVFVAMAPAMLEDGDQRGWLLGGLGGFIIIVGGPLLVPTAFRDACLAVSGTGVTVRFRGSHYTLPWEAVERAGVVDLTTYHRGFRHTHHQLGIAADLDRAIGSLTSRDRRVAHRSLDAFGWALIFPQSVFDLHIEDIVALVNGYHPTGRAGDQRACRT